MTIKHTIVFMVFSITCLCACGQSSKSQASKVDEKMEHAPSDVEHQHEGMELFVSNPALDIFTSETRCYYAKGKYTVEQLRNTEMLCDGALTINHPFEAQFANQNLNKKDLQAKAINHIKTCKLVDGEYWEALRTEYLKKYEFYTDFDAVKETAVLNPAALKTSRFASYCSDYIAALNGSDADLKAMWGKQVEKQAAKSSQGASVRKQFEEDAAAKNWKLIAREYIIIYGWGNCLNAMVYDDKLFFNLPDNIEDRFRDLFDEIEETDYHDEHDHDHDHEHEEPSSTL